MLRWTGAFGRGVAPMVFAVLALNMAAAQAEAVEQSFTDLSLSELMNEPVTTVSKKATRLGDAPTAITVITADDIRRNGITSIPEALRLVPGFNVARINSSQWAISARGLNLQYANTLLVLVDGRSVYTPAFGGVYWDAQDMTLEDLDRIEVIRGPGATLWGANAVNGVVNIISKSSAETQGTLLSAAAGTEERPLLNARHGGAISDNAHFRVYARYFDRDGLFEADDRESFDEWRAFRPGFRTDWQPSGDQLVTLQGDYYSLRTEHVLNEIRYAPPFVQAMYEEREAEGANVVGRWTRTLSDVSHLSVQAYFDSYDMHLESRNTADVQLEHRFAPASRHDVVWGMGYRVSRDDLHLGRDLRTQPSRQELDLYTAFLQDEISLVPDTLRLTVGAKLEHNDFTGLEVQPNLRLFYAPNRHHSFWAAASRAVSTPSRFYNDTRFDVAAFQPPVGPVVVAAFMPNSGLPSQKLDAYELGYRVEPATGLSIDATVFYNQYRDIYGPSEGTPFFESQPVPHIVVPLTWRNTLEGHSHGFEAAVNWRPLDTWNLSGTYSWLNLHIVPDDTLGLGSPEHQASLRSQLKVSRAVELSSAIYYVDAIDSLVTPLSTSHIPSYVRVDTGLLYRPTRTLELGLWGQNLTERRHAEISSQDSGTVTQVPRSVLFKITKQF